MANQRHPDQTLIAVAMSKSLRSQITLGRKKENKDQSTFIRQAIVEKLQKMNVPVNPDWAFAPDRSKAFNESEKLSPQPPEPANKPSSKADIAAAKAGRAAAASARNLSPK